MSLCENEINLNNNFTDYVLAEDCVRRINKNITLFNIHQSFDTIKPITLRLDGDFDIEVFQSFDSLANEEYIMTYRITDVQKTLKAMKNHKVIDSPPKIILKFHMNKQGMLDLKAIINYNFTLWLGLQKGLKEGEIEPVYTSNFTEPITEEQFEQLMKDHNISNYTETSAYKKRNDVNIL